MLAKKNLAWLLLLVRLPATHSAERVAIWRKLKKSGAVQIQTSTYILPDDPARYETFQWLTQHIRDAGGDATLVRVREIEGLSNERLINLFNGARAKEYASLREMLRPLIASAGRTSNLGGKLDRIRKQFREIRGTDFFDSPKAKDVEMVLRKLEEPQPGHEIFAAESGSLVRVQRSIASARPGLFANPSIRKRNSFLNPDVLQTGGACSRSTCWTAISRMTETIAPLRR